MPKTARKRIRRYLAQAAKDYPHLPEISRFPGTEISLTVPDLQTLVQSEKEARRVARRVIHEKLELQRKLREQGDAASRAVQKYRAAQTEANVRGQRVDMLREENADLRNTVSDPPGSAERWQSLRTSLLRAEEQIRTQAGTIEQQDRRMREIAAALSRAYTHNPVQQELERAQEQRERADRAETEVDRQAGLLRGAHKDAERLERLAASASDLRRLVEERGRKNRELTAERDRAVRQRDAAIAGAAAAWEAKK